MKKTAILIALLLGLGLSCFGQMDSMASHAPIMMQPDANTVYKDEKGDKITMEQFGMYMMQQDKYTALPEISDGKILSLQVKKKDTASAPGIAVGDQAPGFKGTLLDGGIITSGQLKGKIVVLNFWFAACQPCAMEMPELNKLAAQYKNDPDIVFLAVTFDSKDAVNKVLAKRKFDYRHVVKATDICDAFHIPYYPTHIVIDKTGRVYHLENGFMKDIGQRLDKAIQDIKNNKPLPPQEKTAGTSSQISFDANSVIEDENGKRLDITQATEMINSGNYDPGITQKDGKSMLILKKKK